MRKLDWREMDNGCIEIISHKPHPTGYIVLNIQGKYMKAHRFIYEQMFGEIPEGMQVCHKCDNRKCVNPEHLFLGINMDNVKDMISKGRAGRKLNWQQAKAIRQDSRTLAIIANEYGVDPSTIGDIKNNRTWKENR